MTQQAAVPGFMMVVFRSQRGSLRPDGQAQQQEDERHSRKGEVPRRVATVSERSADSNYVTSAEPARLPELGDSDELTRAEGGAPTSQLIDTTKLLSNQTRSRPQAMESVLKRFVACKGAHWFQSAIINSKSTNRLR